MHRQLGLVSFIASLALAIAGTAFAGFAGTDQFLPNVGRQAGVFPSNWYTTVWIYNPGAETATARIYLLVRNTANPSPPFVDVQVAAGDTTKLENAVESLFHQQVFGALRVTCDTQKLVVTSRTYSKGAGAGEKDSVGQDFAGVPASFAIGAGEKTEVLGVHQTEPAADSDYRFNFGFVETTGHSVNLKVTAFDETGLSLGSAAMQVREFSQRQLAFKDYFPTVSTENVRLQVEVTSGSGKIIAYGSGIANASQDPTTFEMQYADKFLGIQTVQHDTTLTGDGTAGAPLGLADGAVTQAKLATTVASGSGVQAQSAGPTAGQVLGTNGTSLVWQNAAAGDITAVNTAAGSGLTGGVASGDASLAIAPGGVATPMLADGAVTLGKISATGSANGQVPTSNGSSVAWQNPTGLTLPFTGSAANNTSVFSLTNTGGGSALAGAGSPGVQGGSTTGYGVFGISADNVGVGGQSTNGYGAFGDSTNSHGVAGYTRSSSFAGVFGNSTGPGIGVRGESASNDAVYGLNTNTGNAGCLGCPAAGVNGYSTNGSHPAVWGNNAGGGGGVGVYGQGDYALDGAGTTYGVYGTGSTGVYGSGGATGVRGTGSTTGVSGTGATAGVDGSTTSGDGVHGHSTSGFGVHGESPGSGDGVYGKNATTSNDGCVGCSEAGVIGYSPNSVGSGTKYGVIANAPNGTGLLAEGLDAITAEGFVEIFGNMQLNGNGQYTGSWSHLSDRRFKRDVQPLADALAKVLQLRGVSFSWRREQFPEKHFDDRPQIGFIAQEVEEIYPELVSTDRDGYESLDYTKLTPILTEAIKEQQATIEAQHVTVEAQRTELDRVNERVARLEALVAEMTRRLPAPATAASR